MPNCLIPKFRFDMLVFKLAQELRFDGFSKPICLKRFISLGVENVFFGSIKDKTEENLKSLNLPIL